MEDNTRELEENMEEWLEEETIEDEEDKFNELYKKYITLSNSLNSSTLMKASTRKDRTPKKVPRSWEFITKVDGVNMYKIGKTITILDTSNNVFVRLSIRPQYLIEDGVERKILKGKAEAAGVRTDMWTYVGAKVKEITELKKLAQEIVTYQLSTGEIEIEEDK